MIKFRLGEPEESKIFEPYNTKEGIKKSLESYEGFIKLVHERHIAGYARAENLTEFYVLGMFSLDSSGNFLRCQTNIKKLFPKIPDVLTREEFWEFIKTNMGEETFLSFGHGRFLPPVGAECYVCGKSWNFENVYSVVTTDNFEHLPIGVFAGKKLSEVRELLIPRNFPELWYLSIQSNSIKNEKLVDLTPNPQEKEWNERNPDNLRVMNRGGVQKGVCEDYIVQKGDVALFSVIRHYHKDCRQMEIDKETTLLFKRIFNKSGFKEVPMREVKNEYGSHSYNGPWFMVELNSCFPEIRIGWRKRVIEIVWEDWNVDLSKLFEGEKVTILNHGVHAWGEEKAIEYLKRIKKYLKDNPEIKFN